jgi:hypothetical protein
MASIKIIAVAPSDDVNAYAGYEMLRVSLILGEVYIPHNAQLTYFV